MWVIAIVLLLFLIYIGFTAKRKSPQELGREGETIVASVLGETKAGEKYVINDIIIKDNDNHSS